MAAAIAMAFIGVLELRLAARGFSATVLDSPALWAHWRQRANDLGDEALVFVGASRIQLGIDRAEARRQTGLEPVQLAIDGSSPMPVLEHLADDEDFQGRVVMDVYPELITMDDRSDAASTYVSAFVPASRRHWLHDWLPTFDRTEPWLRDRIRWSLASYADGASPLQSLLLRVLQPVATPSYLVTLPDRSRKGDYTRVQMPDFALSRAARNLQAGPWDYPGPREIRSVEALNAAVMGIRSPTGTPVTFLKGIERLIHASRRLHERGGELLLLQMPTSGYVRAIDERRHPDSFFLDVMAVRLKAEGIRLVSSHRHPDLARFQCPDGSHLDRRDRAAFTAAAMRALGLAQRPVGLPAP